jgi:hypothetical protein
VIFFRFHDSHNSTPEVGCPHLFLLHFMTVVKTPNLTQKRVITMQSLNPMHLDPTDRAGDTSSPGEPVWSPTLSAAPSDAISMSQVLDVCVSCLFSLPLLPPLAFSCAFTQILLFVP